MTFSVSTENGTVVVSISGELDALSAPDLRAAADKLIEDRPRDIVVDLQALRLIDSSGVGFIVSLFRRAKQYGAKVVVRNARGQPLTIFRLLQLDRVLIPDSGEA